MVRRRRFLDVIPDAQAATSAQMTQVDRWSDATITGQEDSTRVSVHLEGSSEPDVVVPSDSGVSAVGASVRAFRDSSGRVTHVSIPDVIPEGAATFTVGVTGERLVQLDATQVDQGAQIDRVEADLDSARDGLSAAMERLTDPDTGLEATQQKANDAATAAVEATAAAAQASVDASSAVVLRVDSTRGLVFKNSLISTVLSVTVFAKGQTITDIVTLHDVFGAGAYLEWRWRRLDDSDFGVISSEDTRIGAGGFTLTVSPADVDTKTVFMCVLNT